MTAAGTRTAVEQPRRHCAELCAQGLNTLLGMVRIGAVREHVELVRVHSGELLVTLVGSGLTASHLVQPHYADDGFGDLAAYFAELERNWRGWDGARSWRSLEGELSLIAVHTGSHVLLTIALVNEEGDGTAEWSAQLHLNIGAGEELSRAAVVVQEISSGSPRL
jgi:hypothetical protein